MIRFPRLSSLHSRIFAIFWLTLLVVVVAVLALPHLDPRTQHAIPHKQQLRFEESAQRISNQIMFSDPIKLEKQLQRLSNHHHEKGFQLYFTNLDGMILAPKKRNRALNNFITIADNPINPQQKLYGRWMMAGPFLLSQKNTDILMYVGKIPRHQPPFFIQILDKPYQLLLLTMLVSTPFLLWLAWIVSTPARRLQQAAERVTKGEFTTDPNLEKGPTEFKKAGKSFNQMVNAVDTMLTGQQRLLSDISHELRSPLTRLRMATALAERKQGSSQELARITTEAERLEEMIQSLLELSRIQIHGHQQKESLNTQLLWEDMLEDAIFEAEQNGKELTYTGLQTWSLYGNDTLLISALENIIRNAIKYAKSTIHIAFTEQYVEQKNTLVIHVYDDGQGVPKEQLTDIFRPFYRVSTARDRDSGGTGLGLAITENAIRQHHGHIHAYEAQTGGLGIEIQLPLTHDE